MSGDKTLEFEAVLERISIDIDVPEDPHSSTRDEVAQLPLASVAICLSSTAWPTLSSAETYLFSALMAALICSLTLAA